MVITQRVLSYTTSITHSLQSESRDIMEAVAHIETLRDILQSVREDIYRHHRNWFTDVEKMCTEVGTKMSIPR